MCLDSDDHKSHEKECLLEGSHGVVMCVRVRTGGNDSLGSDVALGTHFILQHQYRRMTTASQSELYN